MRQFLSYGMLLAAKAYSRLLYRFETEWVEEPPRHPWRDIRLVCFLNHTSLFEWLFVGLCPNSFLWEVASKAVVPAADKTVKRPIVGRFISLLVRHPVSITREADHTWDAVLERIGPRSMVIILPEGRMRRGTGLDVEGNPMTARGGIADILRVLPGGRMLMAYSGGLHHVHVPGERWPRFFRTLRMRLEIVDIETYRGALMDGDGLGGFKRAVKRDLDDRRDRHSPIDGGSTRLPEGEQP